MPKKARGLICEAEYEGSKFRSWVGRDKQNQGRDKTFRTVTHRFRWETDNGDEYLHVPEWLGEEIRADKLSDLVLPYVRGHAYNIRLRGLKEEGGVLQAESREITDLETGLLAPRTILAAAKAVSEEPAKAR